MNQLFRIVSIVLLAGMVSATPLSAAIWDAADGDFSLDTNWLDDLLPQPADTVSAYIANNGAAWLKSGSDNPEFILTTTSDIRLYVGCYNSTVGVDGAGTLTVGEGGSLTWGGVSKGFLVGVSQTGTLNVNGGSLALTNSAGQGSYIYVGGSADSLRPGQGFYNQTTGAVSLTSLILGNNYGVGKGDVSGGTISCASAVLVGYDTASTSSGMGIMRQSGGDVTGASRIIIGGEVGTYGYYQLSGGASTLNQTASYSAAANVWAGKYGYGLFEQTGGTLNAKSRLIIGGDFTTAASAPAYGVFNLSGGTVNSATGGTNTNYRSVVGGLDNGNGILNISGTGLFEVKGTGKLNLGYKPSSTTVPCSGVVNLGAVASDEDPDGGGGTLAVTYLERSYGCSGTLNFHGGTLKARAANATFLNRTANYVYEEGAVIDTNGVNVTIASALLVPTGQGVTEITLANQGTGYTAPPLVIISGGGANASGATAIAKLNATGNVDQIIITNPGVGYTETPTVTLYKGDGTDADGIGAAVTLADNVSGGLTKKGLGILTLSAANTYKGPTAIEGGTLALTATGSIADSSTINVGVDSFFDVLAYTTFGLGGTQTLKGNGAVKGNVITTAAGSHVRPGASIGTLTVTGNLAVGGTLDVEYNSSTDAIDMLAVSGNLDLTGATLSFSDLGAGTLDLPAYVFATYGTLTGEALTTSGVPTNYYVDYDYNNGTTSTNVALVLVPEPSMIVLLILSGIGWVLCSPRRRARQ